MKICITGSTGFVGGALVRYFADQYIEVYACGRKKDTGLFSQYGTVEYIQWDFHHPFPDRELLQSCTVFIHSAGNVSYEEKKSNMIQDNVDSLESFLPLLHDQCHLIYVSSSSVYQGYDGVLHADKKILKKNLLNTYSLSKFLAEEKIIARSAHNEHTKVTIVRPRAVYGVGDTTLAPRILKNKLFGRLLLPGNGTNKTSLIEVTYFCSKIHRYIAKQQYGVVNVSSEVKTYKEVFSGLVEEHQLQGIIFLPIWIFKVLSLYDQSKYSYIVDSFSRDKILV